jgi:hypothetical protein
MKLALTAILLVAVLAYLAFKLRAAVREQRSGASRARSSGKSPTGK